MSVYISTCRDASTAKELVRIIWTLLDTITFVHYVDNTILAYNSYNGSLKQFEPVRYFNVRVPVLILTLVTSRPVTANMP